MQQNGRNGRIDFMQHAMRIVVFNGPEVAEQREITVTSTKER